MREIDAFAFGIGRARERELYGEADTWYLAAVAAKGGLAMQKVRRRAIAMCEVWLSLGLTRQWLEGLG